MDELGYWYSEWISDNVVEAFKVVKTVYSGRTRFQRLEILETEPYGLCLLLDGKMQSSLLDEHIYHETLVHPAMCLHGAPKRVVIIGGGEGATLRETLRWSTVEKVFLVDLDSDVVAISQRFLPQLSSGSFNDSRVQLFFEDGRKWVAESLKEPVDVFLVDVTDPLERGPSYLLYTLEFYELLSSRLREGGVVATHATSPTHTPLAYQSIKKTLSSVFERVSELATFMVSFSSVWGFLYGSGTCYLHELSSEDIDERLKNAGVEGLRFYSGATHEALLRLTPIYTSLKREEPRIIRDSEPLFIT